MASAKVLRSQPFSSSMGSWKKPIAERGPNVSAAMRQPQTTISQGKEEDALRAVAVSAMALPSDCKSLQSPRILSGRHARALQLY
jgi:hypothetical protein